MLDDITNGTHVLSPTRIVLILVVFGIGSWLDRKASDNRGLWDKTKNLVPRSFEASDAPILVVRRGCRGLFLSWLYGPLAFVFYLIGVIYIIDWLSPELQIVTKLISTFANTFA